MGTPKIGRSDILLGIVVLVAIIMVVALFLSQIQGFSINLNLSNAKTLQINAFGKDPRLGTLIVYVENIGSESSDISSEYSFTVNDINIPLTEDSIDKKILDQGQVATIHIPFKISPKIPLVVKIIANGTTFAESKIDNPDSLPSSYVLSVDIQGDSTNKVTKIPDQLSYPSGSSVTLLAESGVDWSFSDWSGETSSANNPFTVVIDSDKNINANFVEKSTPPPDEDPPEDIEEIVKVTFTQTGLDESSTGTILTVEGTGKVYSAFPVSLNVVKGSFLNYEFSKTISSSISGTQFTLTSVNGPNSPINIVSDVSIVANFEKQYKVAFYLSPDIVDASTQPEGTQLIKAGKEIFIETSTSSLEFDFSFWNTTNSAIHFEDINSQNTTVVINGPGNITANYRIPTSMDWYIEPSSIYIGVSQKLIGSLSSLNTNSTVESLNGKNVTLIVTAPNSTQTEIIVSTYSLEESNISLFNYQFVPDVIGVWSVEAYFSEDLIFGDSEIALSSFGVTETPQFFVSFEKRGIGDLEILPTVTYRIDGGIPQTSTVPFGVLVELDSTIEYSYQNVVYGDPGTRYQLDNINQEKLLTITEPVEILGNYKTQYLFTFDQTGLDNSASGTILLVDGENKAYNDLPDTDWFDGGTTYMYSSIISVGNGKRFVLTNPVGTLTITGTGSANGVYEKQFLFEVFSSVGSKATGEGWHKGGVNVSSSVDSPFIIVGPPKVEYTSVGYVGTGSVPDGDETTVEFVIDEPSSVTWMWEGTATLYPNGELIEEGIPSTTGFPRHWRSVSDFGNPFNTNYVYVDDLWAPFISNKEEYVDYYSLEDVGSITGTIDSVTVNAKSLSSEGRAESRLYLRLGNDKRTSGWFDLTQNWINYVYSPNKPGGGSWSWTDINNLECGTSLRLNNDQSASCTLVWVEVKFSV